jgi:hypothetical protein
MAQQTEFSFNTVPASGEPSEFYLRYQWRELLLTAGIVLLLHVFVVVTAFLAGMQTVGIVHAVTLFVESFGLIIVSFMASLALAFLLLVFNVVLLFYDVMVFFTMLPNVINFNSPHCNHGGKMVYTIEFVSIGFLVGTLFYINYMLLFILSSHKQYTPKIKKHK